ncbi:MAG: hypothetical protein KIT45_03335 [Fimbriimonadia bacterium]|nr:hypothetical protein [Fimbriimonadia bacterium]
MKKQTMMVMGFLLAALMMLAGCAKNPVLGKWDASMGPVKMELEFKEEDKFALAVDMNGNRQSVDGTYKVEEKNVTMTFTNPMPLPGGSSLSNMTGALADDDKSMSVTVMNMPISFMKRAE